jgi:hypothetical protein
MGGSCCCAADVTVWRLMDAQRRQRGFAALPLQQQPPQQQPPPVGTGAEMASEAARWAAEQLQMQEAAQARGQTQLTQFFQPRGAIPLRSAAGHVAGGGPGAELASMDTETDEASSMELA